jgi:hypothetical protein
MCASRSARMPPSVGSRSPARCAHDASALCPIALDIRGSHTGITHGDHTRGSRRRRQRLREVLFYHHHTAFVYTQRYTYVKYRFFLLSIVYFPLSISYGNWQRKVRPPLLFPSGFSPKTRNFQCTNVNFYCCNTFQIKFKPRYKYSMLHLKHFTLKRISGGGLYCHFKCLFVVFFLLQFLKYSMLPTHELSNST